MKDSSNVMKEGIWYVNFQPTDVAFDPSVFDEVLKELHEKRQ